MPSFAPRSLEPYKQRELLARRLEELRCAIRSGGPSLRLSKAAERVRSALLGVNKARRSIVAEQVLWQTGDAGRADGDSLERQLVNLNQEAGRLSSLSAEAIIKEYAEPEAAPDAL